MDNFYSYMLLLRENNSTLKTGKQDMQLTVKHLTAFTCCIAAIFN